MKRLNDAIEKVIIAVGEFAADNLFALLFIIGVVAIAGLVFAAVIRGC